jgi:hypothetical protein
MSDIVVLVRPLLYLLLSHESGKSSVTIVCVWFVDSSEPLLHSPSFLPQAWLP